jgi:hypothetical protein
MSSTSGNKETLEEIRVVHVCAVLIVRDDANFKIARTVSRVAHTPTFCNAAHFLATLIRNFTPMLARAVVKSVLRTWHYWQRRTKIRCAT